MSVFFLGFFFFFYNLRGILPCPTCERLPYFSTWQTCREMSIRKVSDPPVLLFTLMTWPLRVLIPDSTILTRKFLSFYPPITAWRVCGKQVVELSFPLSSFYSFFFFLFFSFQVEILIGTENSEILIFLQKIEWHDMENSELGTARYEVIFDQIKYDKRWWVVLNL